MFPILKAAFGQQPNETANIYYYVTFLNNFDFIEKGLPDASVLGVLWSVAIEEQFYFVWPLLLTTTPVPGYKFLFSGIVLLTLVFRAFFDNPAYMEYHTLSCIGDMAVGGLGALFVQSNAVKRRIQNASKSWIITLYGAVFFIFFFRDVMQDSSQVLRIFERLLVAVVFLFVILEQNYAKHSLFKLGNLKYFSKLGTISYGLYCLHFIGILISTNTFKILQWNTHLWQVIFMETFGALLITIFIAALSYRFLESPFLRLKGKLSYVQFS